jgi:SAM-dependent methyltransferase
VQRASERFPGRVHCGALTDGLFPARFFDVVTMFDLFEHVYQPRAFLQTLHAITKDGGVVVITTPNQRSLLARLSGRRWVSYKIPEHVYYYTPATLTRMVAPPFKVELMRAEGQYCTLEFLSERIRQLNAPVGRGLLRVARTFGAKDLSVYVNSGSMTAVLRKRI